MEVFFLWYYSKINMLYNQTDWITEQLEHVLEKGSAYQWQIVRGQHWVRSKITSASYEVVWKIINLIPRQCEIKTIIEEPSS